MNLRTLAFLFAFAPLAAQAQPFAESSALAEGQWFKLALPESGLYRIDRAFLSENGLSADDLERVRVFGHRGGALPQANAAPAPDDLRELPVKADYPGGWLAFYAEGPDTLAYHPNEGLFSRKTNPYSERSFVFLLVGGGQALPMEERPSATGTPDLIVEGYDALLYHEEESFNVVSSGREWYGERFAEIYEGEDPTGESRLSLSFPLEGALAGEGATLDLVALSQSGQDAEISLTASGQTLGTLSMRAVQAGVYAQKGYEDEKRFSFPLETEDGDWELELHANAPVCALDRLTLNYRRALRRYGAQTAFRSLESVGHNKAEYRVRAMEASGLVVETTDPLAPAVRPFSLQGNEARFVAEGGALRQFVAASPSALPYPEWVGPVPNQNLHGFAPPELLIVTHASLLAEAERLAAFRRQNDGLAVAVVTAEQVYNEFSAGRRDPTAIRNFVRCLYAKSQEGGALGYLLLFGDASYDYKNLLGRPAPTCLVPNYPSRNSLHPVSSFGSDDYFVMLDEGEGEWPERTADFSDLDLGVGRIPARTLDHAAAVVDKLIVYGTAPVAPGGWRRRLVFVADNGDDNAHQLRSDFLADRVEANRPRFDVERLFIDAFPEEETPYGPRSFEVRERIDERATNGTLLIDYIGHGSELGLSSEGVLDFAMADRWENLDRLPVFLVATCEFGRHDDPRVYSSGEHFLLLETGGAAALFATTRPMFARTNFQLSDAFYATAFPEEGPGLESLRFGDLLRLTKNATPNVLVNRGFALLGDPSTRFAVPKGSIAVTSINGAAPEEAPAVGRLYEVAVEGEVLGPDGQTDEGFDGTLEIAVYDRPVTVETLGQDEDGPPMTFENRQRFLYRGEAEVVGGRFAFSFRNPVEMAPGEGFGKISLYALDPERGADAFGASFDLRIDGGLLEAVEDSAPPQVRVFLGDTLFADGGTVPPDVELIARISDETGIDLTGEPGRRVLAVLDGSDTVDLTGRYLSGEARYPFFGLAEGPHEVTVSAWDLAGNRGEASASFVVLDTGAIVAADGLSVYPNPSCGTDVRFAFPSPAPGKGMSFRLEVFDGSGRRVSLREGELTASGSGRNVVLWRPPSERTGLFLYRFEAVESGGPRRYAGSGRLLVCP